MPFLEINLHAQPHVIVKIFHKNLFSYLTFLELVMEGAIFMAMDLNQLISHDDFKQQLRVLNELEISVLLQSFYNERQDLAWTGNQLLVQQISSVLDLHENECKGLKRYLNHMVLRKADFTGKVPSIILYHMASRARSINFLASVIIQAYIIDDWYTMPAIKKCILIIASRKLSKKTLIKNAKYLGEILSVSSEIELEFSDMESKKINNLLSKIGSI